MPREREFDPDAALEAIMCLFWRKGYVDTSIDDLVHATGVSRYGLYGTFGGKKEMLLAALDRYRDRVVGPRVAAMEQSGASLPALYAYFESLREVADEGDQEALGCLMCNMAVELAPHDPQSGDKVDAHMNRLTAAFENALSNAKREGRLDPGIDPADFAAFLTSTVQGTAVLARAGATPARLEAVLNVALGRLG